MSGRLKRTFPSRYESTRICSMGVTVDQLLERACAETGLSDFGPGDWRDGLCRLVEAVEAEVDEDSGFIDRIESLQVARLCRRLRVEDWYAGHAAETREAVEGPFVILRPAAYGDHGVTSHALARCPVSLPPQVGGRNSDPPLPTSPPNAPTFVASNKETRPIPSTSGDWMGQSRTDPSSKCAFTTARWCSPFPPIQPGGEQPITEMPLHTMSESFAFSTLTGRPTVGC